MLEGGGGEVLCLVAYCHPERREAPDGACPVVEGSLNPERKKQKLLRSSFEEISHSRDLPAGEAGIPLPIKSGSEGHLPKGADFLVVEEVCCSF